MQISLRHLLASLLAIAFTSSIVDAIPTKLPRTSRSMFKFKRATDSTTLTRLDFQNYAASSIAALQKTYYNANAGLWGVTTNGQFSAHWWPSANTLTMMANYYEKYPATVTWMPDMFQNVLSRAPAFANGFLNGFYDDELWWVLAWIAVYDATGNTQYLDKAAAIYEDSKSVWGQTPCGGLWWDKAHSGVNSVENELYLTASAKLANRLPAKKNPSTGQGYYFEQALLAYAFLITAPTTSMNPDTHLFNDGISMSTCKNNGAVIFTYNQGIILSGLTELTWSTANQAYTTLAVQIANAVMNTLVTSAGILTEKPCEPNACSSDEQQFKGVFTRNLAFMTNRAMGLDDGTKNNFRAFLAKNAESIVENDMEDDLLGLVWSGTANPTWSLETDASALDTIVGAAITALN